MRLLIEVVEFVGPPLAFVGAVFVAITLALS